MQRCRPTCVKTDLVRPCSHRRKQAGRGAPRRLRLVILSEDGADALEDLRLEVGLGDYGDDFVAWFWVPGVCFSMRMSRSETECGGNVPAAPQANAWGRLPRPIIAATMNARMAWMRSEGQCTMVLYMRRGPQRGQKAISINKGPTEPAPYSTPNECGAGIPYSARSPIVASHCNATQLTCTMLSHSTNVRESVLESRTPMTRGTRLGPQERYHILGLFALQIARAQR